MGSVLKPNQIWSVQEQEKQDEEQDLPVIHKSSTASSTASSKAGQDPRSLFDDPNTDKDLIDQDILSLPLFDAYFNNNMISNSSLAKNRQDILGGWSIDAISQNLKSGKGENNMDCEKPVFVLNKATARKSSCRLFG